MADALDKLLEHSSSAIGRPVTEVGGLSERYEPIRPLLERRNGFWAGFSALHVLPYDRSSYPNLSLSDQLNDALNLFEEATGGVIFAFDVYGMPFIFRGNEFGQLDYGTGKVDPMGSSVADWARILVEDFSLFTGWPLAEAWQKEHGELPVGVRLFPTRPFFMGGEYKTSNLRAVSIADGFGAAAQIYNQTKNLPDGTQVQIVVADQL